MMKKKLLTLLAIVACAGLQAQPRYDMKNIQRERLDRGVVALRQADGKVVVSWRTLMADKKGEPFDVYRNGTRLNDKPLKSGGTFFIDEHPVDGDATYEIKGGKTSGSFVLKATAPAGYLSIPLQKPADGITPDGRHFTYSANDASVGDVDGDGQYEIILKWDPSYSKDNSFAGFSGNTYFDCYRLDGQRLWRIDMGRNIRSGAHYIPFIVYDLDGDGKAELMVKTADGTVDGQGHVIGDPKADWREDAAEAAAWYKDHREDMAQIEAAEAAERKRWEEARRSGKRLERPRLQKGQRGKGFPDAGRPRGFQTGATTGRILEGPEYITVFNGLTGAAMATTAYVPERGNVADWGDNRGNRSERYLAGVGYFDGHHPSAIFCRGYYTRTVIAAWDWDGKQLTSRWTFDTNQPQWNDYAGQGNHNLRVADVDGDGCDEITYGSMAVDHDGRGLYSTRMGHGDAIHLTAFDPTTDKLQVWDCHENRHDGSDFRDAATGKVVFQIKSNTDVGRAMAADIDPNNPGVEMWSSDSRGIRNIKGEVVVPRNMKKDDADGELADNEDDTALYLHGRRLPTNFGIWWDGDLLRELLDHEKVYKYDWNTGDVSTIFRFEGCKFNNGTKSNPCLSADILGDWREEVVTRTDDSSELRIYVTPEPTDHRINCLMEDIPYRLSVAAENVGYNQPPETGFYLGPDKSVVDFLK